MIISITTDRTHYAPGQRVHGRVALTPYKTAVEIVIVATYLNESAGAPITLRATARAETVSFVWVAPPDDFRGYLLTATVQRGEGQPLFTAYGAVDVSSVWTRFPRYGYVWNYTEAAEPEDIIDKLSRFHINALQ